MTSAPIPVDGGSRRRSPSCATALNVPATMQPGDTIQPTITITNFGTAPERAGAGGPRRLHLPELHRRQLDRRAVHAHEQHPPRRPRCRPGGTIAAFSQTASPLNNTFTFTGPAVTLPTSPGKYYLGVVVDPYGQIQQLSLPTNLLAEIQVVGPTDPAPAAGRGRVDGQLQPVPAAGVRRLHRHQSDDDHDLQHPRLSGLPAPGSDRPRREGSRRGRSSSPRRRATDPATCPTSPRPARLQ